MHSFKILTAFAVAGALVFALCACTGEGKEETTGTLVYSAQMQETKTTAAPTTTEKTDGEVIDADTYVYLSDEATTINGEGALFENGVLTITLPGTYSIKGTLSDGQIFVNCNSKTEKVKLYLEGVELYCSTSAPIFIENSPVETQIILADQSVNSLSDNEACTTAQTDAKYADAVIYSKDDLQIEGTGTLNINAKCGRGIFSKNDIQLRGGVINITSVDDGIRGKDGVEISDGKINITAGGDGIRTNADEADADKGDIVISGGTIHITSTLDGIQASRSLKISAGNLSITAGGGATESILTTSRNDFGFFGARPGQSNEQSSDSTASGKGLKSEQELSISGGTVAVSSLDDAVHSNSVLTIKDCTMSLETNDDGLHAEITLTVENAEIIINQSYEALEAQEITINGGTVIAHSADDGLNAASASDAESVGSSETPESTPMGFGGKGGGPGGKGGFGGGEEYDSDCRIEIEDATVYIYADGDGIDSNGDVEIDGGTVIVYGPTNSGNGALDYSGSFKMNGGTLLAVGASGMAQSVTESENGCLAFNCSAEANTLIVIADENNNEVFSFESPKAFSSVVFVCPQLESGKTYQVISGGTHSGESVGGIYEKGQYSGGTTLGSVTAK